MAANPAVLIVDDEPAVRELLRRWLTRWGYERVRMAADATQALEAMLAEPASIMLVDINMPGHDGFWLIERVRTRWPHTAFIMATGASEMATVTKSRQVGAVDYVLKPFGHSLLQQALDRAAASLPVTVDHD